MVGHPAPILLGEDVWRRRSEAHRARISALTAGHEARVAGGAKHPVHDFLFTYYSYRPSWLKRWHPGIGVALAGAAAEEFLGFTHYSRIDGVVTADPKHVSEARRAGVAWILDLLRITANRPPSFACFGLHEWAMVYKQSASEIRHADWPLRFPVGEIARIVEAASICCTHFDAFRFFTTAARPLNRVQPARETVRQHDQRGCLHVNMDLYKWAYKLAPFSPSELVADAFELARDIREVDMRASPYDLRALSFEPITIETPEGRAEYERYQREFAVRSQPIRARLIAVCESLLAAWSRHSGRMSTV